MLPSIFKAANALRLALFPIAYGASGALIGGTLNRVMVVELGYPISVVSLFFALPLIVSPLRVWLGHSSDTHVIFGRRREPFVVLGAVGIAAGITLITVLATRGGSHPPLLMVGIGASFVLYGIGRNLAHNSFQALLAGRFGQRARARVVTLFEVTTLVGLIAGAGVTGGALREFSASRLVTVSLAVSCAIVMLALAAVWNQENSVSARETAARARALPFPSVFRRYVLSDPQVLAFFVTVFLTFVGTLAQDVLLEPYGGLVLGMEVSATTTLTAYWGVGVMISMLASGTVLLRYIPYLRLMQAGILSSAVVFAVVIITGISGGAAWFPALVGLMGLATGIAGAGMLSGVVSFTTPMRAGLLVGVWGVANMAGHAFGSLMGGLLVDLLLGLTGSALLAYSAVFAVEIGFLLVAFALTLRLKPQNSRAWAESHQRVEAEALVS